MIHEILLQYTLQLLRLSRRLNCNQVLETSTSIYRLHASLLYSIHRFSTSFPHRGGLKERESEDRGGGRRKERSREHSDPVVAVGGRIHFFFLSNWEGGFTELEIIDNSENLIKKIFFFYFFWC